MKVADMTREELVTLIDETVEKNAQLFIRVLMFGLVASEWRDKYPEAHQVLLENFEELLKALEDFRLDPDEGKELQPEFVEELRARVARYEAGESKGLSIEGVERELGLRE